MILNPQYTEPLIIHSHFSSCHSAHQSFHSFFVRSLAPYSRDPCWIHVVRVLFASVPSKETQTVATLLEQIFSQSVLLAHQVVAILDDTAVRLCELCGNIAQKCVVDDDKSSSSTVPAVMSCGSSTVMMTDHLSSGISISTIPTQYTTHRELEGIPLLTVADVHLVLLLSRSLTGAQRSMEACGSDELVQFQLPPMLVGTTCDVHQMIPSITLLINVHLAN